MFPSARPRTSQASERALFLGDSDGARRVRREIRHASGTDATVLIVGESGCGKEIVAREVHRASARQEGPFVPVNCAAIPESLFEAELFGFEAGAFTDAKRRHRGVLERAHRGTLFLDEVGDLALSAQPKLLRAIENGETCRVGGETTDTVDVRFVAATNHGLGKMCREGRFRADLLFRLRVIEIRVPPLRDRKDDIVPLAEHFARLELAAIGMAFDRFDDPSKTALRAHPWTGNVRELRSVVARAVAAEAARVLHVEPNHLALDSDPRVSLRGLLEQDWKTARQRFEKAYAERALERAEGDVREAARAAGLVPRSLYKMLRRLGLRRGLDRSPL